MIVMERLSHHAHARFIERYRKNTQFPTRPELILRKMNAAPSTLIGYGMGGTLIKDFEVEVANGQRETVRAVISPDEYLVISILPPAFGREIADAQYKTVRENQGKKKREFFKQVERAREDDEDFEIRVTP